MARIAPLIPCLRSLLFLVAGCFDRSEGLSASGAGLIGRDHHGESGRRAVPAGISGPLGLAVAVGAAVALAIFLAFGEDKAVMFGPGVATLAALPLLSGAMKQRARAIGERPFWRFLTLLPLLLFGIIMIGYWAFFLSSSHRRHHGTSRTQCRSCRRRRGIPGALLVAFRPCRFACALAFSLGRDRSAPASKGTRR